MIRLDTGACRDADPHFFHPAPDDSEGIEAAQEICARCPIRLDCLALALGFPDARGIWGGLTEDQRAAHRRGDARNDARVRMSCRDAISRSPGSTPRTT